MFAPILESNAVTQVPIFCPMIIGIAALYPTAPVIHSACRIPTDAEEDWISAVSKSPASIPSMGLENLVSIPVNSGTSASGFTAALIVSMPNISTAKPSITVATLFGLSFLENIRIPTATIARIGEKEVGLHICTKNEELSIPVMPRIHAVIVVPILAPMMMPTACCSFMMPELTKPTTMTVVADEDWITAVTPAPTSTALNGLFVSFSRMLSNFPPLTFASPSPSIVIP